MTSSTVAMRSAGGYCAACNQRTAAWICQTCALSSAFYSAHFNHDKRTSPKRRAPLCLAVEANGGPAPLPALNTSERIARIRDSFECRLMGLRSSSPESKRGLLAKLKHDAVCYEKIAARVDAVELQLQRVRVPDHWERFTDNVDPIRCCIECAGVRVHLYDCVMIATEGRYVGGFDDDGTKTAGVTRFGKLATPNKFWAPIHHRQHARAQERRWRAFKEMWTKIGLAAFTALVKAGAPKRSRRRIHLTETLL